MTRVEVFIPWSPGLDTHRRRALRFVVESIRSFRPARLLLIEAIGGGEPDPDAPDIERFVVREPWNKSMLMNLAFRDVLHDGWCMMLDGDVVLDGGLREAFERVQDRRDLYIPFSKVSRLDEEDTAALYAGLPLPEGKKRRSVSVNGGGAYLMRRDAYLRMRGFDERLDYMEDTDFARRAADRRDIRLGRHARSALHLWHPPVQRDKTRALSIYNTKNGMPASLAAQSTFSCIGAP